MISRVLSIFNVFLNSINNVLYRYLQLLLVTTSVIEIISVNTYLKKKSILILIIYNTNL